eukprot:30948-Pelagococcus_subviridis.AAC.7
MATTSPVTSRRSMPGFVMMPTSRARASRPARLSSGADGSAPSIALPRVPPTSRPNFLRQ